MLSAAEYYRVEDRFRGTVRPIVVLERWANGPGGERWHLLDGADSLDWTLGLGDEEPAVVVARPQPGVGSALEAVVFSGGVHGAAEADLPLGGELGWFAYPDVSGAAGLSLAGVTPDREGRVDALWDADLTLIR